MSIRVLGVNLAPRVLTGSMRDAWYPTIVRPVLDMNILTETIVIVRANRRFHNAERGDNLTIKPRITGYTTHADSALPGLRCVGIPPPVCIPQFSRDRTPFNEGSSGLKELTTHVMTEQTRLLSGVRVPAS